MRWGGVINLSQLLLRMHSVSGWAIVALCCLGVKHRPKWTQMPAILIASNKGARDGVEFNF